MRKSYIKYISKHLVFFAIFIVVFLMLNIVFVMGTSYGRLFDRKTPEEMLDEIERECSVKEIENTAIQKLRERHIWAMYLNANGDVCWSVDLPENFQMHYTIQEIVTFSKWYLQGYPVFIRNTEDGILVLGYPKNSFAKFPANYYEIKELKIISKRGFLMIGIDILILFMFYSFSRRKIVKNMNPLLQAIEMLSEGKSVSLSVNGELCEIADGINQASYILSRQNEARANWISGVSHDIRTPLSLIMGYTAQLAEDSDLDESAREKARIIRNQSTKIKELVQDLNLVSQLEYEMQPLNKEKVRLSKLIRTYAVELLNSGIADAYSIEVEISPEMESALFECDSRLISRAVANLVQNSMNHNPQGCDIRLGLCAEEHLIQLTISDNGIGMSEEKQRALEERPHYLNSVDERLDLRHGLGLILVRQITEVHGGQMQIESRMKKGFTVVLKFPN